MKRKVIEKIMSSALFQGCNYDELADFLAVSQHQIRYKAKGDFIARKGDGCTTVMLLVEGTVCTNMINKVGKEIGIETYVGPIVLAPACFFALLNHYPVNAVAHTDCTLLYIDRATFIEWLHFDRQIMLNFISIISGHCHHLSRLLNDVALRSLKDRVTEYLIVNKKIKSVERLARMLGVARPSLSRVLSELKAEGFIERTPDGLELRVGC